MEPTSKCNPRKNTPSITGLGLTTFELNNVEIPEEGDESLDPFREYLSNAAYAIRCACHATHRHSSGELVFGRDMFMPISKNIDWNAIKDKKQKAIAKSNLRENSKRKQIHYNPGARLDTNQKSRNNKKTSSAV